VEKRLRLGDLEGDLIVGRHQLSHIVVVADRVSRMVGIEKVRVKTKREVNRTLHRIIMRIGRGKTLTLDNGLEFSGHEDLAKTANVKIYFAHAYAAWERGTVENMNGLLRQFLPKKTDFRRLSKKQLREIEDALNNRPRKCLRYRTPIERHCRDRS
jgi:IS30 family transposase